MVVDIVTCVLDRSCVLNPHSRTKHQPWTEGEPRALVTHDHTCSRWVLFSFLHHIFIHESLLYRIKMLIEDETSGFKMWWTDQFPLPQTSSSFQMWESQTIDKFNTSSSRTNTLLRSRGKRMLQLVLTNLCYSKLNRAFGISEINSWWDCVIRIK